MAGDWRHVLPSAAGRHEARHPQVVAGRGRGFGRHCNLVAAVAIEVGHHRELRRVGQRGEVEVGLHRVAGDRRQVLEAGGIEAHVGVGGRDVGDLQPRGRAVPPVRVRRAGGTKLRLQRCGEQIVRVAEVGLVLEVEAVVGLHQRALVVLGGCHLLVAVAPGLVDVPHGQAGIGQVGVAAELLAVLDDKVFGGLGRVAVQVKLVHAGAHRRAARAYRRGRVGPAGLVLQVGADLHGVGASAAEGH